LIFDWKDLEAKIGLIEIERASEKIQIWWKNYKQSLLQLVQLTVEEAFLENGKREVVVKDFG
jgi:hypothetical protein